LAERSTGFTGMGEANPGAETAATVVAREGLPADFASGFAIDGELGALVGPAAVPGINRENQIGIGWGRGKAERDSAPIGNTLLGGGGEFVDALPRGSGVRVCVATRASVGFGRAGARFLGIRL